MSRGPDEECLAVHRRYPVACAEAEQTSSIGFLLQHVRQCQRQRVIVLCSQELTPSSNRCKKDFLANATVRVEILFRDWNRLTHDVNQTIETSVPHVSTNTPNLAGVLELLAKLFQIRDGDMHPCTLFRRQYVSHVMHGDLAWAKLGWICASILQVDVTGKTVNTWEYDLACHLVLWMLWKPFLGALVQRWKASAVDSRPHQHVGTVGGQRLL